MTRNEQVLQDALLENGISLTVGQIRTLEAFHRTDSEEGEVKVREGEPPLEGRVNWRLTGEYPPGSWRAKEQEKMDGWYRKCNFGIGSMEMDPVMAMCLITYFSSRLSRGNIPHPEVVMKVLTGETPTPRCGYIGCGMEYGDHTH